MTSICLSCATLILCCYLVAWSEALDCRRFVFAPLCRGVSAKRSNQPSLQPLTNYQIVDYDSSEEAVSTPDYEGAEKTNSDDDLNAQNDQMMLYLLSRIPKMKSKSRMRPLLNVD